MTLGSDSICKLLRTGGREAVQRCVDRDASGIGEGWEGGVSTEIPPWLLQVLAEIPRWSLALDLPTPPSLPYRPPLLNHVSPIHQRVPLLLLMKSRGALFEPGPAPEMEPGLASLATCGMAQAHNAQMAK